MMFANETLELAAQVIAELDGKNWKIVTAESCTGGLIAGALTSVAGSSSVVHGGYVTYANEAKIEMIGVPKDLINQMGAVSAPVARAMARGAMEVSGVELAVAVTGIAGPGGGLPDKPVGLVHVACASGTAINHKEFQFGDIGRDKVRQASINAALNLVHITLKHQP